jgi:hypothetical protein
MKKPFGVGVVNNKKRKSMKKIIGMISLACALLVLPLTSDAQDFEGMANDKKSIEAYGQVLDMTKVSVPEGFYTWEDVQPRLIKILPESAEKSMAVEQLCDHMHMMYNLYSKENEIAIFDIAGSLDKAGSPLVKEAEKEDDMYPSYHAVSSRLFSSSGNVNELFEALPENKDQIILAQNMILNEMLISYVHDAAIAKCSAYAEEKGYVQIWAPVELYEPSEDPGWKNVPWYNEE